LNKSDEFSTFLFVFQRALDRSADDIWNNSLKTGIQNILNKQVPELNFEELYRNVYGMVLHKYGDKVYMNTKELIAEHLNQQVREMMTLFFS
jgi:hypothetical protein